MTSDDKNLAKLVTFMTILENLCALADIYFADGIPEPLGDSDAWSVIVRFDVGRPKTVEDDKHDKR